MTRTLSTIAALAFLTILALPSCSKNHEVIDSFDDKLVITESEKLISIANQIAGVNAGIEDLNSIRDRISSLRDASSTRREELNLLNEADNAISNRISALQTYLDNELKKYATSDYVASTYATLAQFDAAGRTISDISNKLKGMDTALSEKIKDASKHLAELAGSLESAIAALAGKVDSLERRIQAVTIVPAGSDGSVEAPAGILQLDCIISPSSAIIGLKKDDCSLLLNKSGVLSIIAISDDNNFQADAPKGILSVKADISEFAPLPDEGVSVALHIRNKISDYTTEFVPTEFTTAPVTE